ncbi:Crp/Fnr family transcriptional regulator [Chitinophaga pinensis]|uniref:Transcriptional regulator, Crp/Fnr family n=1 Tax=Chitinophaga pinensis (strain ATCC 43595 / DSM 2588 / LMG 13176 / NBRC 15968 / NCIMB 11800 / UQM 2034) TaxID=485918 RepID=A0A979G3W0_CHIPD|nr:Crp/Fnr family transcriptional regulator [Chitinophaga pinensis]ACU60374.1 putative transcriptional regulator, Crp/Fnr family [Chitinophaga pinensis DSM 2588]
MDKLIEYLLQFGALDSDQIQFISNKGKVVTLVTNEYFSEAGKTPKYVGFILKGIFRTCFYNNKGDDITHDFIDENNFVTDMQKFEAQAVATEYIQAITDCEVIVFTKKDWDDIGKTIANWDAITGLILRKCIGEILERRNFLVTGDATARYISFMKKFPTFINRIPLSYIASYLGMAQPSLSRIRKNISEKNAF